ncbi:MAG: hypothetical protein ACPL7B_14355, partial [Candidatus Poribacteria bacterium]
MFFRIFISHLILALIVAGMLFAVITSDNDPIRLIFGFILISFIIAIWISALLYRNLANPIREITNIIQRITPEDPN